jgi:hypothetical protein
MNPSFFPIGSSVRPSSPKGSYQRQWTNRPNRRSKIIVPTTLELLLTEMSQIECRRLIAARRRRQKMAERTAYARINPIDPAGAAEDPKPRRASGGLCKVQNERNNIRADLIGPKSRIDFLGTM